MDRRPAHEPVDSARAADAGPLVRAAVQRLRLSPASGDHRIGRGDAHRPVLLRLCGHPGRVHGIVRDAVPRHGQRRTWRPAIAADGDADAAQHRHDLRHLPRPGAAGRRRAPTSRTRARRQSQARAARHRREHGAAIGDSPPPADRGGAALERGPLSRPRREQRGPARHAQSRGPHLVVQPRPRAHAGLRG